MSQLNRLSNTLALLFLGLLVCSCGSVSSVENNPEPDTSVPAEDDLIIPDVPGPNTPDLSSSEDVPVVQIDSNTPDTSVSDSGNSVSDSGNSVIALWTPQ